MQETIKLGDAEMPLNDFVVSRNAILGITKSGKTFTAKGAGGTTHGIENSHHCI